MVAAVESSGRVANGTQQRSWEHFILGKQIVELGKLGQITFGQAYWYQTMRPCKRCRTGRQQAELEAVAGFRSRSARQAGALFPVALVLGLWGGALTDLMTHWIDVIQWYMGTPAPKSALATGRVYASTWECPDT
jgi:predicted dehydrogenase